MTTALRLFLFTTDVEQGNRALSAGVDGFVIDWEQAGKERRQDGFDTEINCDSPEDLARMSALAPPRLLCRINGAGEAMAAEVEDAIAHGATDVLLPMVTGADEVHAFCDCVAGRARPGILVECEEAMAALEAIARAPVELVYVGLNDLRISRRARSIFDAVLDGTVERVRKAFPRVEFGFGGLTVLDGGSPIPCRRFLEEMSRVGADFTFLRRSFKRDIVGRDMTREVWQLRKLHQHLAERSSEERQEDFRRFAEDVERAFGP